MFVLYSTYCFIHSVCLCSSKNAAEFVTSVESEMSLGSVKTADGSRVFHFGKVLWAMLKLSSVGRR